MAEKAEELRLKVQKKVVDIIAKKLEQGEMNEARAKAIAKMVLEKLPEGISYEKLIKIIPTLDDHFQELSQAVVPIMVEYEKKMKKIVNDKIKNLLIQGKFDEILKITDKAMEFEKSLS